MSEYMEQLFKIAVREAFLNGWEHAQFMQKHSGHLNDTAMIAQYRAELLALRECCTPAVASEAA